MKVLAQFIQKDSRISVVRQKNHGLAAARNTGYKKHRQKLLYRWMQTTFLLLSIWNILILDCILTKMLHGVIQIQLDLGVRNICGGIRGMQKDEKINLLTATAAIRKNAFKSVGGYHPEKWAYHEDWRFWLELLAKHQYPVHVKGYLFWYRRSEDGMLAEIRAERRKRQFCRKIIKKAAKKQTAVYKRLNIPL